MARSFEKQGKPTLTQARELVPPPKGQSTLRHAEGITEDIISVVLADFKKVRPERQTRRLAPLLKGASAVDTLRNVWEFVRKQVRYKIDPIGKQWIKTPSAVIHSGFADCKGYSTLTADLLVELGFVPTYRFVAYKPGSVTHVYTTVNYAGREYVLDSCLPNFDTEKPYQRKQDYSMAEITSISGHDGINDMDEVHGIGALNLPDDMEVSGPEMDLYIARANAELEQSIAAEVAGIGSPVEQAVSEALDDYNEAVAAIAGPRFKGWHKGQSTGQTMQSSPVIRLNNLSNRIQRRGMRRIMRSFKRHGIQPTQAQQVVRLARFTPKAITGIAGEGVGRRRRNIFRRAAQVVKQAAPVRLVQTVVTNPSKAFEQVKKVVTNPMSEVRNLANEAKKVTNEVKNLPSQVKQAATAVTKATQAIKKVSKKGVRDLKRSKLIKKVAKTAKKGLRFALKAVTLPQRLFVKALAEVFIPKMAMFFLYLFITNKSTIDSLPAKVKRKRNKAAKFAKFMTGVIGMRQSHFMGLVRRGIMKRARRTPEQILTGMVKGRPLNGIGAAGAASAALKGAEALPAILSVIQKITSLFKKKPSAEETPTADDMPSEDDFADATPASKRKVLANQKYKPSVQKGEEPPLSPAEQATEESEEQAVVDTIDQEGGSASESDELPMPASQSPMTRASEFMPSTRAASSAPEGEGASGGTGTTSGMPKWLPLAGVGLLGLAFLSNKK